MRVGYTLPLRSGRYSSSMEKKQNDLTIEANKLPGGVGRWEIGQYHEPLSLPSPQSFHPLSFLSYNSVSQCEALPMEGSWDIPRRRSTSFLIYLILTVPSAG